MLDQKEWTPKYFDQTISELVKQSVEAVPKDDNPGLIIWPESPAPFFIADPRLQQWLVAMAQDKNSYLVVGTWVKRRKSTAISNFLTLPW